MPQVTVLQDHAGRMRPISTTQNATLRCMSGSSLDTPAVAGRQLNLVFRIAIAGLLLAFEKFLLAFLVDAYDEDEIEGEQRTVLRLHPALAPVKVAVLPLVRKDGQPELAHEIYRSLRDRVQAEYDEGGAIGRRYRRQDEIGTPWAVTIDHQSLEDRTVTVRDRDSLKQIRIAIDELGAEIERRLREPWKSPKLAG